jgi:CheY-like chemotaxis protein
MWTDRLRSRKTILVVENDPVIRGLLCRALRPAYHILQAANAEDAVRIAAQHRRNIDLLLTEVKLPRLRGWELLELLALDYPELKVIYVTKSIDPEMRAHTRRQKVVLLEEPFPMACLQQTVCDLLENPQSMRAGVQRPAPSSLLLRMRDYLRRRWWIHRTT